MWSKTSPTSLRHYYGNSCADRRARGHTDIRTDRTADRKKKNECTTHQQSDKSPLRIAGCRSMHTKQQAGSLIPRLHTDSRVQVPGPAPRPNRRTERTDEAAGRQTRTGKQTMQLSFYPFLRVDSGRCGPRLPQLATPRRHRVKPARSESTDSTEEKGPFFFWPISFWGNVSAGAGSGKVAAPATKFDCAPLASARLVAGPLVGLSRCRVRMPAIH